MFEKRDDGNSDLDRDSDHDGPCDVLEGHFNPTDEEALDLAIQREITRDIWGILRGA